MAYFKLLSQFKLPYESVNEGDNCHAGNRNPDFLNIMDSNTSQRNKYGTTWTWFQTTHSDPFPCFCYLVTGRGNLMDSLRDSGDVNARGP